MPRRTKTLERIVLDKGDRLARKNRAAIDEAGVLALNLIGSPGCGKTMLLEKTIAALHNPGDGQSALRVGVIEGDIQTTFDRDRIRRAGAPAVQIETQGACHLDAAMVAGALAEFPLGEIDILMIENVGNLVCPADFPLGTDRRLVVISVTEGDDMVRKHPMIFQGADVAVINKMDLADYMEVDVERVKADYRKLSGGKDIIPVSVRTGEGLGALLERLLG